MSLWLFCDILCLYVVIFLYFAVVLWHVFCPFVSLCGCSFSQSSSICFYLFKVIFRLFCFKFLFCNSASPYAYGLNVSLPVTYWRFSGAPDTLAPEPLPHKHTQEAIPDYSLCRKQLAGFWSSVTAASCTLTLIPLTNSLLSIGLFFFNIWLLKTTLPRCYFCGNCMYFR